MFTAHSRFRGIDIGSVIVASFHPKAKMWGWSDGNNNSYHVPSWKMKAYFKPVRRAQVNICDCGSKSYIFSNEKYICLPCIWKNNGVINENNNT